MSFYFKKPRYERSNPLADVVEAEENNGLDGKLGPDHVTKWKRIKPKTVIELCLEGKLERRVVALILDLGIISREALRKALMSKLNFSSPGALKVVEMYSGLVF